MQVRKKVKINYPKLLSLTSLGTEEFRGLLEVFEQVCENYFRFHDLEGKPRKIPKYGEDARCSLPGGESKLYFILTYMKENPGQAYHGELFGMGQPKVSKWVKLLTPLLASALGKLKVLPKRCGRGLSMILENKEEPVLWLDATERDIPRSVDHERQRYEYSGKKKRHTVKNNLLSDPGNRVLYLSDTYAGSVHDKAVADEAALEFPEGTVLCQDLGYVGYAPENVTVVMPKKNHKNKPLSVLEQDINWLIGKARVQVEHVMAGVKRLKIVKEKIRLKNEQMRDLMMWVACGTHNLRIQYRGYMKKSE